LGTDNTFLLGVFIQAKSMEATGMTIPAMERKDMFVNLKKVSFIS